METEIDLWPDLNPLVVLTPAAMLKVQAAALSRKTNGLLQGLVETRSYNGEIYHQLFVVVPALENYRYTLLTVHHSPNLYPVFVDESPMDEPSKAPPDSLLGRFKKSTSLADQDAFHLWLGGALSHEKTKRVLENLLAQAAN